MKTDRQQYWRDKGYTQEQIENHLRFERAKSKQSRERRKANNEKNKKLIDEIKTLFLDVEYKYNGKSFRIFRIAQTVDGKGFWYNVTKKYKDGSSGNFHEFTHFEDFNAREFRENMYL